MRTLPLAKPRSLRHCITIFSVLPDAKVRVMLTHDGQFAMKPNISTTFNSLHFLSPPITNVYLTVQDG